MAGCWLTTAAMVFAGTNVPFAAVCCCMRAVCLIQKAKPEVHASRLSLIALHP
jgi:hypothetical protein